MEGLVERLVEPDERRQPLGPERQDDPAAVGGVGLAADEPGPLQPIHQAGHRAAGEPGRLGELAGRLRPAALQEREDGEVGAVQPQPLGHDLAEEVGRLAQRPQGEEGAVVWRGA